MLSAVGIGLADVREVADLAGEQTLTAASLAELGRRWTTLEDRGRRALTAQAVADDAIELVRKTRIKNKAQAEVPDFIRQWVSWGAGPRASQYLVLGAKARAVLDGRFCASMDDLRAVALPVLRHRILTNFSAEADGITTDTVIEKLLETTPPTEGGISRDPNVSPAFSEQ